MELTTEQKKLVIELLEMSKDKLYPRGLIEPDWALIERIKEIKKELGL